MFFPCNICSPGLKRKRMEGVLKDVRDDRTVVD